jgi:hypothetical protein
MDAVWVGKAEVSITSECALDLDGAGAFVWCATQACDQAVFISKVGEMLEYYNLVPIAFEKVGLAANLMDPSEDLFEIITRAEQDPAYAIYGTFHCYPYHAG